MLYRVLADAVLILHLAFVLWVVLGGFLVLRWPQVAWAHLPATLWGAFVAISGFICPLTHMELEFRERGGEAGYTGGFIEHYVTGWLYPEGLTRPLQIGIGVFVTVLTSTIYHVHFQRLRRRQRQHRQAA